MLKENFDGKNIYEVDANSLEESRIFLKKLKRK
jgi:hypothetical protein